MLPVSDRQLRPIDTADWWKIEGMGGMLQMQPGDDSAAGSPAGDRTMTVTTFEVDQDDPRATVLLRDSAGRAVVVAGRYGFGAVTLIGLDLTAGVVKRHSAMVGDQRVWHHVFGWNWPALTGSKVKAERNDHRLTTAAMIAQQSQFIDLGTFIPAADFDDRDSGHAAFGGAGLVRSVLADRGLADSAVAEVQRARTLDLGGVRRRGAVLYRDRLGRSGAYFARVRRGYGTSPF